MGPLRFASRSTLKGPGIFDRSGQRSLWHFGALPASAGRLSSRRFGRSSLLSPETVEGLNLLDAALPSRLNQGRRRNLGSARY